MQENRAPTSTTQYTDDFIFHQHLFDDLKRRDIEFWKDQRRKLCGDPDDAGSCCIIGALNLNSLCFYGEVSFLLLGLKPCVLFTFAHEEDEDERTRKTIERIADDYVAMIRDFINEHQLSHFLKIAAIGSLKTENFDLTGAHVLCDMRNPTAAQFDKLVSDRATRAPSATACVSEKTVASALDYPAVLPEGEEMNAIVCHSALPLPQIVEVAYFDVSRDGKSRTLVTSFGARMAKEEIRNVREHFRRYKRACKGLMNLEMEIGLPG